MNKRKRMRRRRHQISIRIRLLFIFTIWSICFLYGFQSAKKVPVENHINENKYVTAFDGGSQGVANNNDNNALVFQGKRIVIDAGHGGSDSGTIGPITGINECETNLSIAIKLEKALKELGATVRMTRTTENTLKLGDSRKCSDEERAKVIEAERADLFLSIHQNFNENDSSIKGVQVLVRDEKYLQMAELFQAKFNSALNVNLNCINKPYRLLQYGNQPSFIIESGFFSNPQEERTLQTEEYKEKIISILIDVLSEYWKL